MRARQRPLGPGQRLCSSHDDGTYLNKSYNGVAAGSGPTSGTVEYSSTVIFDEGYGYNCVELAARYLYATTTINPPEVPSAWEVASAYASAARKLNYNFPLSGWTSAYSTGIAPGDIISMKGGSGAIPTAMWRSSQGCPSAEANPRSTCWTRTTPSPLTPS